MKGLRRIILGTATIALALGFILAVALGVGKVELTSNPSRATPNTEFVGAAGHRWELVLWGGSRFGRAPANIRFVGAGAPPLSDLDRPEIAWIPYPPWRDMIREAAPQCTKGTSFFNLQAWGFPFRSMAGGFAKGPPSQVTWYWEFSLGGHDFSLPYRPIWPGLIGNTLVYAAILWAPVLAVTMGLRFTRTQYRNRRGRCTACGYDLRGTPADRPCPECGRSSSTRRSSSGEPRMSRTTPHPRLALLLALAACAVWALPAARLRLYPLREFYRVGEAIGVTHSTARLAGQILGLNFRDPPAWYSLVALGASAAIALSPGLIPALWLRLRLTSGRRALPVSTLVAIKRSIIALAAASAVYATLDHFARWWLWTIFRDLGEVLGGQPIYAGGALVGPDGPFFGGAIADRIGNLLTNYGSGFVTAMLACGAAIAVHMLLWRRDLRMMAARSLCPGCGYDCSATPAASPCPECGRALAQPAPANNR